MRLLCSGCVVVGVAAALVLVSPGEMDAGGAPSAPSGEVAPPAQAGGGGAGSPAAASAGAREAGPAAEVMAKLLSARSSLGPIEADFSWVIGPVGAKQQALEGRLSLVDASRYRVGFASAGAAGSGENLLLVPDGRWAYQFSNAPGTPGLRVDLVYLKERVRDPAARVPYDPTGGVLLELLGKRGYVTYEGDEDLDAGRCAVLSYEGGSFRSFIAPGAGTQQEGLVHTRLHYRYEDGLLVAEEELDSTGRPQSTYRLRAPHRFTPPADLLEVPQSVHCVDMTKQLVRRILYGPPQPVPGAAPR